MKLALIVIGIAGTAIAVIIAVASSMLSSRISQEMERAGWFGQVETDQVDTRR